MNDSNNVASMLSCLAACTPDRAVALCDELTAVLERHWLREDDPNLKNSIGGVGAALSVAYLTVWTAAQNNADFLKGVLDIGRATGNLIGIFTRHASNHLSAKVEAQKAGTDTVSFEKGAFDRVLREAFRELVSKTTADTTQAILDDLGASKGGDR